MTQVTQLTNPWITTSFTAVSWEPRSWSAAPDSAASALRSQAATAWEFPDLTVERPWAAKIWSFPMFSPKCAEVWESDYTTRRWAVCDLCFSLCFSKDMNVSCKCLCKADFVQSRKSSMGILISENHDCTTSLSLVFSEGMNWGKMIWFEIRTTSELTSSSCTSMLQTDQTRKRIKRWWGC